MHNGFVVGLNVHRYANIVENIIHRIRNIVGLFERSGSYSEKHE